MTYEEMRALLRAIGDKRRLLLSTERRLAEAKAEADGLRGGGGVRVSGGVQTPAAQRYIEEVERLERRAAELAAEVHALEEQVEDAVRTLSAIEQTVIRDRFFSGKRWRLIQREIGYAEAQPYRIAKKAVKKLAKIVQKPKDDSK